MTVACQERYARVHGILLEVILDAIAARAAIPYSIASVDRRTPRFTSFVADQLVSALLLCRFQVEARSVPYDLPQQTQIIVIRAEQLSRFEVATTDLHHSTLQAAYSWSSALLPSRCMSNLHPASRRMDPTEPFCRAYATSTAAERMPRVARSSSFTSFQPALPLEAKDLNSTDSIRIAMLAVFNDALQLGCETTHRLEHIENWGHERCTRYPQRISPCCSSKR